MPLIDSGSKKAFGENVRRLIKEGKSREQSLAIAGEVQRKHQGTTRVRNHIRKGRPVSQHMRKYK